MKRISIIFTPFRLALAFVRDRCYDLQVFIHSRVNKNKNKKPKGLSRKKNDMIFYCVFAAVPLIMFVLVNVVINGNSILLAFQRFEPETGRQLFYGFGNFKALIDDFVNDSFFTDMLVRSVYVYLTGTVINMLVPIIFSYYIYKKLPMHKVFKVVLFIPTMMSSIITVSMFKRIANGVIPNIMAELFNVEMYPLLNNPNSVFSTVLIYNIWMGLGGGLLTHLAAMNTVDESVSESARLDGVGFFKELWHVVLPACYQVLTLGIITGFAAIFTNTLNLFAFSGLTASADAQTLGYYFQVKTLKAETIDYNYLSAWGLMITVVAVPVTLLLRHLIYTYGPSEDSHEKKRG